MKEELKELVAKHLPSLAAGEMSKYIEQAEKDKELLKQSQRDVAAISEKLSKVYEQLESLKTKEATLNSKELTLAAKESELTTKEINFKVAELTYQLSSEKSAKGDIFKLVETFVKNPRALEVMNYSNNECQQPYYSGNNYVVPPPITRNEYKTTEKLETKE